METTYVTLYVLDALCLIVLAGVNPSHSEISLYELERLAAKGDLSAKKLLDREERLAGLNSLVRALSLLLAVPLVPLGLSIMPAVTAVILTVAIILVSGLLSRVWPFKGLANLLVRSLEPQLIHAVGKFPVFFRLISGPKPARPKIKLSSSEELIQLVVTSVGVLSDSQKRLISAGLVFDEKLVLDVMTPRDEIEVVKKNEVLGPMVLNDLHNMGHSHIPVIDRDIDHVVGMLNAADLLVLSADSKSPTVDKVMSKKVQYVAPHDKLTTCLTNFLKDKQHLAIVVDRDKATVGLITLTDILTALVGRNPVSD